MQISVAAVVLFGFVLEMVGLGGAYKTVRPYKYYNPRPWRPLRWHPLPKYRKDNFSKRVPAAPKHSVYKPDGNRYAPRYEDSVDPAEDDKPYIIFIQLPQRKEKGKKRPYRRLHVAETSQRERDTVYIDDDADHNDNDDAAAAAAAAAVDDDNDDGEFKVYRLADKVLKIKVNN